MNLDYAKHLIRTEAALSVSLSRYAEAAAREAGLKPKPFVEGAHDRMLTMSDEDLFHGYKPAEIRKMGREALLGILALAAIGLGLRSCQPILTLAKRFGWQGANGPDTTTAAKALVYSMTVLSVLLLLSWLA